MINETINYLGRFGRDKVTGFQGVVSSVCFDLFGCIQVVLVPEADKDGKLSDGHWFDIHRIVLGGQERIMDVPDFSPKEARQPETYQHGAAEKPPLPRR